MIEIRAPNGTLNIDKPNVYFAFGDGRFGYDCVACEAQCCRGHGYRATSSAQVLYQLNRSPLMRFFTASDDGSTASVRNLPPACFFLTEGNRCGIHAEHGFGAKPETCRLFPFNNLVLIGSYLVVSPHVNLCPLELNLSSTPRDESRHDALFDAMASQGIGAPIQVRSWGDRRAVLTMELEQQLCELSERAVIGGDLASLLNAQIDATAAMARRSPELMGRTDSDLDEMPSAEVALSNVRSVLGLSTGDIEQALVAVRPLIAAMSPALRIRWILGNAQSKKAKGPAPTVPRLPLAVGTTGILAALAKAAGMTTVTYQTVMNLAKESESLIYLLSHLDQRMQWRTDQVIPLPLPASRTEAHWESMQRQYIRVARLLLPLSQRKTPRSLASILRECGDASSPEWMNFLRSIAVPLRSGLVPVASAAKRSGGSLRSAFQRWSLEKLDDRLVLSLCRKTRDAGDAGGGDTLPVTQNGAASQTDLHRNRTKAVSN
jgi:Fe-S-cluster containining protein